MRSRGAMLGLLFGLSAVACGVRPAAQPNVPSPGTPTLQAEAPAEAPSDPSGTPIAEPEPDASDITELSVWMVEDLSPRAEAPGGQTLLEQFATFDEMHPGIRVEVRPKSVSGRGSTLDYLRTSPPVAPTVLPDLVLLNRSTLVLAAREGLIIPWDAVQDETLQELRNDFYSVASELGRVDDVIVGLPYLLEIRHSIYRADLFEDAPPTSFEAVLDSAEGEEVPTYLFPAARTGGLNRTTLLQYFAAGGRLADDEGNPSIDASVLGDILTFYQGASEEGILDPGALQYSTPDETWSQYLSGEAELVEVSSLAYLAQRTEGSESALASIPTVDGEPITLVTGWMWALVTENPDQQAAAATLLAFLMQPVNQGVYAQEAETLPAQPDALAVWGDDPYATFADSLLAVAIVPPDPALDSTAGVAMQSAVQDVLLGRASPQEAASEAAATVAGEQTE